MFSFLARHRGIFCILKRFCYSDLKMLSTQSLYAKAEENAKKADETIAFLEQHLARLEKLASEGKFQASFEQQKEVLKTENQELRKKVGCLKKELEQIEVANGLKLVDLPNPKNEPVEPSVAQVSTPSKKEAACKEQKVQSEKNSESEHGQKNSAKKEKKKTTPTTSSKESTAAPQVDVSRLDLRVGQIIKVERHPDADTLYMEEIDVGEEKPRTVVTGVVKHIPIEQMQNRKVMALCNLKPVKMRGVFSQAMVMCASSPECVEILDPPSGCVPGDLVECEGYPRTPDDQLNPKKKIFEKIQPDLHTDDDGAARYKGSLFLVPGKPGYFKSQTMKNSNIK